MDDAAINEENPRIVFPVSERDGKIFEFRKTLFLCNGFRIKGPVSNLIVVEGFTLVWWLAQNGLPDLVCTMGADCSERHAEFNRRHSQTSRSRLGRARCDSSGTRHAQIRLNLISPHRFVRWVKMADGKQPTGLSREQLKICFSF